MHPTTVLALLLVAAGPATSTAAAAASRTYYVAHGGDDEVALERNDAGHPWATLGRSLRALAPGDTLVVRGAATDTCPAPDEGACWNEGALAWDGTRMNPYGEAGRPITIKAQPGEYVRFTGTVNGGSNVAHFDCDGSAPLGTGCPGGRCLASCPSHLVFGAADGGHVVFDGANAREDVIKLEHRSQWPRRSHAARDTGGVGPHHITFQSVEIRNATGRGAPCLEAEVGGAMCVNVQAGDYLSFIDTEVHRCGYQTTNHDHCYYWCGKKGKVLRGSCHHSMQGVQVWTNWEGGEASDNLFQGTSYHDIGKNPANGCEVSGPSSMASGIGLWCGRRNVVRDNTFRRIYQEGVLVGGGAVGTLVTGNTFERNNAAPGWFGARRGRGGLSITGFEFGCGYNTSSEDGSPSRVPATRTVVTGNRFRANRGGALLRGNMNDQGQGTDCGGACPGSNSTY